MSRLGNQLKTTGSVIFSSIAARLPERLRKKSGKGLSIELESMDDLEIALYTGDSPTNWTRWPRSGWISASVSDLSILTQSATVPPEVVDRAANVLIEGVSDAAGLLANIAKTHPGAVHKISEDLKQEDGEQTRRMAATILANAFVFMESLAGGPGDLASIRSLEAIKSSGGGLTKGNLLAEWRQILAINYWPIFDVARRILEHVPAPLSEPLIACLAATADRLLEKSLICGPTI